MKKFVIQAMRIWMLCFLSVLLFAGCTTKQTPNEGDNSALQAKVSDYYPFKADTIMHYEGIGIEYAEKVTSVDFIQGNRIQIRTGNGGTVLVSILEIKEGELRLLYAREECYYRENLLMQSDVVSQVLLKEPLEKGTTWYLEDGRKRYISEVDKPIATPNGNYEAIEVTTDQEDGTTQKSYYAKGIGLVKEELILKELTVSSTLEKIEENKPVPMVIRVYHPYFEKDAIAYVEKNAELRTNDDIKDLFERELKMRYGADLSSTLTEMVNINRVSLNLENNSVDVDLSKSFVEEMNAGSGFEGMLLESLACTFGSYYGVNSIALTIDGKPYEGGHYAFKEGELITIDSAKAIEYEIKN